MNHRADDGRVAVVVRPLDRALNLLRLALVPSLALMASLPVVRTLTGSLEVSLRNWALVLFVTLIIAVYAALMQAETVRGSIDRSFARVRRRVALACDHDEVGTGNDWRAACLLTPEIFRVPLFQYDEQARAVGKLLEACGDNESGQYWFVEGESGSGKTRTALRLVQALSRDRHLFELGTRCHLYDFGEGEFVEDEFRQRLGTSRHEGAVVFVDNFQLIRAEILSVLTNRLLDRQGEPPEQLLVFLTRKADAWNLRPDSDVRLIAEAKARGRHLPLEGASPNTVTRFVSRFDRSASERLFDLEHEKVATAAQLHLAQVIARRREAPPEALAMLALLKGEQSCAEREPLARTLAIVAALSIHRGVFSRRDLRHAVRASKSMPGGRSPLFASLQIWHTFWRLHRIGIVPKILVKGSRFLFHEAIAELCVDRLSGDPIFQETFAAVGRSRLENRRKNQDDLTAWLIAAEVGAQKDLELNFDEAFGRGAYQRMARCLRRASRRYRLLPPARLQLAILLDRVGEFEASRAEITDDLVTDLSESGDLAVILAASRIESGHDRSSEAAIEALIGGGDPLGALVGRYWKMHMAGHRGNFDSRGMLRLASSTLTLIRKRETHWWNYALARMHFDSLRQHYLEGGKTAEIESPERRTIDQHLSDRLPIYEALHLLYGQAHLVSHVLLPQLAIFGQPVKVEDVVRTQIGSSGAASIDTLAIKAQRLYQQSREAFWQYGDREADYLQVDILNAEMIQRGVDLSSFQTRLLSYQQFVVDTGFEELFSYPHFYFFRWCMLQRDQALASQAASDRRPDELLEEAKWHLKRIIDLDGAVENRFGVMRAEMLSLLLEGVHDRLQPVELHSMATRMEGSGYGFEARLMRHLAARPVVTHTDLREVFRYYPFVHQ